MKKYILIFLSLVLSFSLVSCGSCDHEDENNDRVCDLCEWNFDHEHTLSKEWSIDDSYHWHEVECGHSVGDKAPHVDANNDAVCDECAWDYDHLHTYDNSWSHDKDKHWHNVTCDHTVNVLGLGDHVDKNKDSVCDVCSWDYDHEHTYDSEWSLDDDKHWHKVTCGHDVSASAEAAHSDDDNDGLCDGCAWNFEHVHTFDDAWSYDAESHWHSSNCSHEVEISGKTAHVDDNTDGVCDVCEYGKTTDGELGDIELPEVDF